MSIFRKYFAGLIAPFAFVGALSGCSSSGYRPQYQSAEEQRVLAEKEYGESIDVFAAREIAFISSSTDAFAGNDAFVRNSPTQDSLIPAINDLENFLDSTVSPNNDVPNHEILYNIVKENYLLQALFKNNRIQRWLAGSAKNNADFDYDFDELNEFDAHVVESQLEGLVDSVGQITYADRQSLTVPPEFASAVDYNHKCLDYVLQILTAKADIESIEFNVKEMNLAYALSSRICKSVTGVDEDVIANGLWQDLGDESLAELFDEEDSITANFDFPSDFQLNSAYNNLLYRAQTILKNENYCDKHDAFQSAFSYLYSIPSDLYHNKQITLEGAVLLKKKITRDIAELFLNNHVTNEQGISKGQVIFSLIPGVGLFGFEDWRNAVSEDWFSPEGSSPEEQYASIIREGRRINSGNGSAAHFVGSTAPAIISRALAVGSTAITASALALSFMPDDDNHDYVTIPVPQIGGGGTISPGNGSPEIPVGGGGTVGDGIGE